VTTRLALACVQLTAIVITAAAIPVVFELRSSKRSADFGRGVAALQGELDRMRDEVAALRRDLTRDGRLDPNLRK
jgi:hypothetical protein